jgi:hypothetical protein
MEAYIIIMTEQPTEDIPLGEIFHKAYSSEAERFCTRLYITVN